MPIFYVERDVLQKRLHCVVCPARVNKLYLDYGICGEIFRICGRRELEQLFWENLPLGRNIPAITNGLKLSEYIIHIVLPQFLYDTFKEEIYESYNEIFKMIKEKQFYSVVFPPLPFSYKRIGSMNAYRTCINFTKYFLDRYTINSNIYILIDKRSVSDHINNYVSTYVATSWPYSNRKKAVPREYPFITQEKFDCFINNNKQNLKFYDNLIGLRNYNIQLNNRKFECVYKLSKAKYPDDFSFCFASNISKECFVNMFENDYKPKKYEFIAMLIALKLSIAEIEMFLSLINSNLDKDNECDIYLMCLLENNIYDLIKINERMFVMGFVQLGSFIQPYE